RPLALLQRCQRSIDEVVDRRARGRDRLEETLPSGNAIPEDETNGRGGEQEKRKDRERRVIGERGPQPVALIFREGFGRVLEQLDDEASMSDEFPRIEAP